MPPTIRWARTTNRRACAQPSARFASACACAEQRPSSGLGMLRLWPHLHVSLLRRPTHRWIRAVQLRDARHGQAFRRHRDAVYKLADPELYDTIIITNLCVPTASGVPLAAAAQGNQRRPHRRHRRSGIRHSDARRGKGCPRRRHAQVRPRRSRARPRAGPAHRRVSNEADGHAARRNVPRRSHDHRIALSRSALPPVPSYRPAKWRELYGALDCAAVAAIHPFYKASIREFEGAGRKVVGSAPVGHDGTAAWLENIGAACNVSTDKIDAAKAKFLPAIRGAPMPPSRSRAASRCRATKARSCSSPRLLVESGADVALRRHGLPTHGLVRR